MARSGLRKYEPLADYLAALAAEEMTLTLAEIEAIIGAPLPPSARDPTFWSNSREGLFRVRPWLRASWRVARTDLRGEPPAVTFARRLTDPAPSETGRRARLIGGGASMTLLLIVLVMLLLLAVVGGGGSYYRGRRRGEGGSLVLLLLVVGILLVATGVVSINL